MNHLVKTYSFGPYKTYTVNPAVPKTGLCCASKNLYASTDIRYFIGIYLLAQNLVDTKEDTDVIHEEIEDAMGEIEDAIRRMDDGEDDDKIILPPEEDTVPISDLDATDALENLQNYC